MLDLAAMSFVRHELGFLTLGTASFLESRFGLGASRLLLAFPLSSFQHLAKPPASFQPV